MTKDTIRTDNPQIMPFNPARVVRVYTASKTRHAEMLKGLRGREGVHFTARWPLICNLASESTTPTQQWMDDNFDDIIRSQVVLVYAEEGEHLKWGIGEVGYAIAHGKEIWLIGDHPDYEPWKHYKRLVHHASEIEEALEKIRKKFCGWD